MRSDYYYFVICKVGGKLFPIGPYRTEKAANNRMDRTKGEVHLFRTLEFDKDKALEEFMVPYLER